MISRFFFALTFFTRIPAGPLAGDPESFDLRDAVPFFPLVGLVIGACLIVVDLVSRHLWPPAVTAVLDTVFLLMLTGGLHMDGLADTADGLFSCQPKDRVLDIMKDSRIGAMGAMAMMAALMLKTAGFFSIALAPLSSLERTAVFLLIPSLSRTGMMIGIHILPYGRESGTGASLFSRPVGMKDTLCVIPLGVLASVSGWPGVRMVAAFLFGILILFFWYRKRLGCITGDMLGCQVEVVEVLLALAAGAHFQWSLY